ncbi:MAG TPA: helix-turn-helix transcriptional regulator [Pyrinomonadaceae bacterium]|nr:helix-turn-helix transcriptional regulator [Pyrinomonadaceae bacterium]
MPRKRERRKFGPENLASKLRQLRHGLGLSQSQMVRLLDAEEIMQYGRISEYERGRREPSLWVLLAYARAARIHLEDIVDDEIKLPAKLPGDVIYPGSSSRSTYHHR